MIFEFNSTVWIIDVFNNLRFDESVIFIEFFLSVCLDFFELFFCCTGEFNLLFNNSGTLRRVWHNRNIPEYIFYVNWCIQEWYFCFCRNINGRTRWNLLNWWSCDKSVASVTVASFATIASFASFTFIYTFIRRHHCVTRSRFLLLLFHFIGTSWFAVVVIIVIIVIITTITLVTISSR